MHVGIEHPFASYTLLLCVINERNTLILRVGNVLRLLKMLKTGNITAAFVIFLCRLYSAKYAWNTCSEVKVIVIDSEEWRTATKTGTKKTSIQFTYVPNTWTLNLLKPTGYVMYQQFNIQQLYVLPTLYLCVLYLSENKQRLVLLTA